MIRTALGALCAAVARSLQRLAHRQQARQLLLMDDVRLADIGLTRDDVRGALRCRDPYARLAEARERNYRRELPDLLLEG